MVPQKTFFPEDYKCPVGDWLEHRQDLANLARANLKHVRKCELTRRNRMRRAATIKVGDLVPVHHLQLPTWPRNCLQDPYFGPYRIIKIDGSRMHVRCSPRLGAELLCAPKQLRHYHSPDELSWDKWSLSHREVERIDLENAANPEEADQLEEMTADGMAVDGYYVVAGIARQEYKQGWKFRTLWEEYGLSEANWEPMSAFIQPDGSINPIFRSYLDERNEGQLLTRAETLSSGRSKTKAAWAWKRREEALEGAREKTGDGVLIEHMYGKDVNSMWEVLCALENRPKSEEELQDIRQEVATRVESRHCLGPMEECLPREEVSWQKYIQRTRQGRRMGGPPEVEAWAAEGGYKVAVYRETKSGEGYRKLVEYGDGTPLDAGILWTKRRDYAIL